MKTLFFGTQRVYGRYMHALHIYEDNGEIRVTALQTQCIDTQTLNNSEVLEPSNYDIIKLCKHAQMAGLRVKVPQPDYSSIPYDLTEKEFLECAASLKAFPTPDGGIACGSQLNLPMHYEKVRNDDMEDHYSRLYTDVKRENGTIVRIKWRDQVVARDPHLCESDLDEVGVPEDLKHLIMQKQEKERYIQEKAKHAYLLEDLKKRLERAGIPYEE